MNTAAVEFESVSSGGSTVIVMNGSERDMVNSSGRELPADLQRHVHNGALDETAARRLATRREVLAVLWGLARQAGIEQQLVARLAG